MDEQEARIAHVLAVFETEVLLSELDRVAHVYEDRARQEQRAACFRPKDMVSGGHTPCSNYHYGRAHAYQEAALALRLALDGESPGRPTIAAPEMLADSDGQHAGETDSTRFVRREIEDTARENGWAVNEGMPLNAHLELIRTDIFRRGRHGLDVNYMNVPGQGYLGEVSCAYYDGRPVDEQDKAQAILGLLKQATLEPTSLSGA